MYILTTTTVPRSGRGVVIYLENKIKPIDESSFFVTTTKRSL